MTLKSKYPSRGKAENETTPFDTTEEAWFWFVQAQQAKNDGARFLAGHGLLRRPCEPVDFLKVLDRLYRQRRLQRDHLLVLRHYGRRQLAPDLSRVKEARAHFLWMQAMERIEPVLIRKGIVHSPVKNAPLNWMNMPDAHMEGAML